MCYECYREAGKPVIINDKTKTVASLISKVYEYSTVGGNAHVVIDDWNLDDDSILSCINNTLAENIHEAEEDQIKAERTCLSAMLELTPDERASAMALYDGFIEQDGENYER